MAEINYEKGRIPGKESGIEIRHSLCDICSPGMHCGLDVFVKDGKILKVIVETCYLTEEEKIRMCKIVRDAGADYIKTSTGFGTGNATPEDVTLFARCLEGSNVKIKASGGIRTWEDAEMYLSLGADRLGSSALITSLAD